MIQMRNALNFLLAIAFPLLMLGFFFLVPLRSIRRARTWRETPCVIVSSSVSQSSTDSGLYRILVTYQYVFAGRYFSSSRYSFSPSFTVSARLKKRRVSHRLSPGAATICYVDPDNPRDAVIERGLTWDMVLAAVFSIICLSAVFSFVYRGAF